jgi:CheY-like chemotaxis protein
LRQKKSYGKNDNIVKSQNNILVRQLYSLPKQQVVKHIILTRNLTGIAMEKRILVVDDEKMIRDMLEKALNREGYTVVCAESGEEALAILNDQKIFVMFLDLKLPGMNGLELCSQIRDANPMVIAYAITGFASDFELADCRDAGFEDYFTKPVDLKTLFGAAEDAFDKVKRWQAKHVAKENT